MNRAPHRRPVTVLWPKYTSLLIVGSANGATARHTLYAGTSLAGLTSSGEFVIGIGPFTATGTVDNDGVPDLAGCSCEMGGNSGLRFWQGASGFDAYRATSQRVQLGPGCLCTPAR